MDHATVPPDTSQAELYGAVAVPEAFRHTIVGTSIPCRYCGYDIHGLRADGQCPECGTDVFETIQYAVDPAVSRLPSLRNPRAVGNGLFGYVMCLWATAALLILSPVAEYVESSNIRGDLDLVRFTPRLNWPMGVALLCLGLWSLRQLAPPPGTSDVGTVHRDLRKLLYGLLIFLPAAVVIEEFPPWLVGGLSKPRAIAIASAVMAGGSVIALRGLRSVLMVIGDRSSQYRRSKGGRQGVEALMAALAAMMIGVFARVLTAEGVIHGRLAIIGSAVLWASIFMLMIGLCYLLANAWWIRKSLRNPPATYETLLAPVLPPDTSVPIDDPDDVAPTPSPEGPDLPPGHSQ